MTRSLTDTLANPHQPQLNKWENNDTMSDTNGSEQLIQLIVSGSKRAYPGML